jgi:hypothetical protein
MTVQLTHRAQHALKELQSLQPGRSAERLVEEGLQAICRRNDLEGIVERPTMREWLKRTEDATPIPTKRSAAQLIRVMRDSRDAR